LKKGDGSPSPFLLAATMSDLTITTERLSLRPYRLSDAPRLRELVNDVAIARMLKRVPHPYPQGEAERWIGTHAALRAQDRGYIFAIESAGALAGTVSIEAHPNGEFELGYWLAVKHWGKGFATEAVHRVLAFAFDELALPYVRASHLADNPASGRVLGKVGFLATGRARRIHAVRGAEVEFVEMVLPKNAFIRDDEATKRVYKAA
jgi:ribosomal-protein-alanine N-acetyltransferase